ncbi:hypothetical protein EVA_06477 [gut metagenome]|uniref:Uncharacterized protein n=1 Tax=gut metagenome TaxID=749906 RepID=J9GET5_9ZZZZ
MSATYFESDISGSENSSGTRKMRLSINGSRRADSIPSI